jgi:50S ribosomal protein uL3
VIRVKTPEKDGYAAVQLGFDETSKPRKKPQQAYLERLGLSATRFVREVPFLDHGAWQPPRAAEGPKTAETDTADDEEKAESPGEETQQGAESSTQDTPKEGEDAPKAGGNEEAEQGNEEAEQAEEAEKAAKTPARTEDGDTESSAGTIVPGATVGVSVFKETKHVDVRGVTKGRGFAGVIRRYRFNAGPKSHGSKNIREPGSTGMHTDPARVPPGKKMPGHMGAVYRKARNLEVVKVEEEDNLLVVKGSVPGPKGSYVYIEESLSEL